MGCSGGGTQTAFLAAIDPRIGPAVVACYSSTYERQWAAGGVATQYQHLSKAFAAGLDKQDLFVARAPRPTLQLVTTDDPAFPLQGAREMLTGAAPAFAALGAPEAIEGHEAIFAHGWVTPNNEAMYRFFARHFALPAGVNTTEKNYTALPCRALTVTQTGRVIDSIPGAKSAHDLLVAIESRLTAALETARRASTFLKQLPSVSARVSGLVEANQTEFGPPQAIGSIYAAGQRGDAPGVDTEHCAVEFARGQPPYSSQRAPCIVGDVEKWVLPSEQACISVVWIRRRANSSSAAPAVVLLSAAVEASNGSAFSNAVWEQFDHSVAPAVLVVISLCGLGETAAEGTPRAGADPPRALGGDSGEGTQGMPRFMGRSTVGFHAGELRRALLFVSERPGISRVAAVVAADHTSPAALHALVSLRAAHLNMNRTGIAILSGLSDYGSVVRAKDYATPSFIDITGVLGHYDLPDLSAALAPRSQLIIRPVNPMLQPLSAAEARVAFAPALSEYARQGRQGAFTISAGGHPGPVAAATTLGPWLLSLCKAISS